MDANERRRRAGEEAAEWWVELQESEVPETTRVEFVNWLRESAVHVAEMLRVADVNGVLAQFPRWSRISTEGAGNAASDEANVLVLSRRTHPRTTRAGRSWYGALAAAVAATTIAVGWYLNADHSYVIQTGRAEPRQVALADGSALQIDPETRLVIKLGTRQREIVLETGRALFHVAGDPNRPFLVRAGGTVVRAVGTAFGVDREKPDIVVTVAEGRVAVLPGHGETLVTAGQQVIVTTAGTAQPVRNVDSERELAWARGRLVFTNETVVAIMEQFNRYSPVQLHVTDQTLANRRVTGMFDATEPESFVAFIEGTTPVHVVHNGRDITLSRKD